METNLNFLSNAIVRLEKEIKITANKISKSYFTFTKKRLRIRLINLRAQLVELKSLYYIINILNNK